MHVNINSEENVSPRASSRTICNEGYVEKFYSKGKQQYKSPKRRKVFAYCWDIIENKISISTAHYTDRRHLNLIISALHRLFPFIWMIHSYDCKNWLANDITVGLTIGVIHIPQGKLLISTRKIVFIHKEL